jgi:hypothetical protein
MNKKFILRRCVVIALVALSLIACKGKEVEVQINPVTSENITHEVTYRRVTEFYLSDGTFCVGGADVGLACDFGNSPKRGRKQ